jgi:arsenate reductase (thioredoxin)
MAIKILFVCIENAGRSQMAEGFARSMAGDKFDIYSAGSKPSGKINPLAVEVMNEAGIDISNNRSKGFKDLPIKQFDYIVTMGCGDACPIIPSKKHVDWELDDPKGKSIEEVRKIRDIINEKVKNLPAFLKNV